MSRDSVWSRIMIGGTLERSDLSEFVDAIREDASSLVDVGEPECEKAAREKTALEISDDNNYTGEWDALARFCRERDLTYCFYSEGFPGADPVFEFWRPDMGNPWAVYAHDDVVAVSDLVKAYREGKTLAEVIADTVRPLHFTEDDVPPLVIDGT